MIFESGIRKEIENTTRTHFRVSATLPRSRTNSCGDSRPQLSIDRSSTGCRFGSPRRHAVTIRFPLRPSVSSVLKVFPLREPFRKSRSQNSPRLRAIPILVFQFPRRSFRPSATRNAPSGTFLRTPRLASGTARRVPPSSIPRFEANSCFRRARPFFRPSSYFWSQCLHCSRLRTRRIDPRHSV